MKETRFGRKLIIKCVRHEGITKRNGELKKSFNHSVNGCKNGREVRLV